MKNFNEIAQAIKNHLDEEGMHMIAFEEDDDSVRIGFDMHIPGQISHVHYIISVHSNEYSVFAVCPIAADSKDSAVLGAMSEFITRVNYVLKSGNFELDYSDGEIRYKCYVNCEGQIPSDGIIRHSIGIPGAMMERYSSGIIAVLFKGMSAKEAVEMCESAQGKGLLSMLDSLLERVGIHSSLSDRLKKSLGEDTVPGDEEIPSYEEFLSMFEVSDDGTVVIESDCEDEEQIA